MLDGDDFAILFKLLLAVIVLVCGDESCIAVIFFKIVVRNELFNEVAKRFRSSNSNYTGGEILGGSRTPIWLHHGDSDQGNIVDTMHPISVGRNHSVGFLPIP